MSLPEDPRNRLRSTSMPIEALTEALPASGDPLDAQLLELFFDRVPMGVAVFGTDKRLLRCNKTWTGFYQHYLGVPPEYTAPGVHIHDLIPGNEESVDELFAHAFAGRVVRQAAHRITIPGSDTYWDVVFAPLFADGEVVGVLDVVTDATDRVHALHRLQLRVDAFSRMAAGMSLDQPVAATLAEVADAVRATTPAVACSIVHWEEADPSSVTAHADPVLGDGFGDALAEVWPALEPSWSSSPPGGARVHRGARTAALERAELAPLHPFLTDASWEDVAVVALVASGAVLGQVVVHLEAGQRLDDDVDFLAAVADQAVVALRNATLYGAAEESAALVERHRLARELHDSVSQALFSMTLHARAAQRHLRAAGQLDHPAAGEVDRLHELTRAALAEMRALIFELRPEALEAEGLAQALARQAAAVSARTGLPVSVRAPSVRLALPVDAEENLYRLVLEAVNNAVKHAEATSVTVTISASEDVGLEICVADDGTGFDPDVRSVGHLGMATMRDRAAAAGAHLEIDSAPGAGTRIRVSVPPRP